MDKIIYPKAQKENRKSKLNQVKKTILIEISLKLWGPKNSNTSVNFLLGAYNNNPWNSHNPDVSENTHKISNVRSEESKINNNVIDVTG